MTSTTLSSLQRIFGDCVPKAGAIAHLEQSPLAPTSAQELQELRVAALETAGKKLSALTGERVQTAPASGARSELPDVQRLQLQQLTRAQPAKLTRVLSTPQLEAAFALARNGLSIPWGFLEEGCLHRAYVLAKALEDQGYFSEQVFVIPHRGDLVATSSATPSDGTRLGTTVGWYHEAVCVWVNGEHSAQRRVIDPSLADAPLTIEDWLSRMRSNVGGGLETFFLPRFAYGLLSRDDPPSAWNDDDLATARAWTDEWRAAQKALEEMDFYSQLKALIDGAPDGAPAPITV
jgi:hypothetical protein